MRKSSHPIQPASHPRTGAVRRRKTVLQCETLEPRMMLAETSGYFNGAAYLSASRANAPVASGNDGYTIEAWVKRVDANRCEAVVSSGYRNFVSSGGFFFGMCGAKPFFNSNVLTGSGHSSATTIPANVWTHIAVTWGHDAERFYVNGELDLITLPGAEPNRGQTRLYVGATANESPVPVGGGPLNFFNGNIAEARMWDTVRTQEQIRHSMHELMEAKPAGLVGAWHLSTTTNESSQDLPTINTSVTTTGPASPPVFRVSEVDANFNRLSVARYYGATATVTTTNTAYLFGGRTSLSTSTNQILAVDMGTGTSHIVGTLPIADGYQAAAYVPDNNSIYVFGGRAAGTQIIKYDLTTGVVSTLAVALPTNLSDSVAVWHPKIKRIVLLGGYGSSATDTIQLFNPADETVVTANVALPAARYVAAASYSPLTDRIYMFGGFTTGFTQATTSFEIDVQAEGGGTAMSMPQSASLPLSAQGATAVEDPDTHLIYVLGGSAEYVQSFDPRTGQAWRSLIRMPRDYTTNPDGVPLYATGQSVVFSPRNHHALAIGGFRNFAATNNVWRVPLGTGPAIPIEQWDFINDLTGEIDGDDRGVYVSGNGTNIPVMGIDEHGNRTIYGYFGFAINDLAYSNETGLWIATANSGAYQVRNGVTQQFATPQFGTAKVYSVQPEWPSFGTDRGLQMRDLFSSTYQTFGHPNTTDIVWAQTGAGRNTWAIVRDKPPADGGAGPWRLLNAHLTVDFTGLPYIAATESQSDCGDATPWRSFGLSEYNDLALDRSGNLWVVGHGQGAESVCFLTAASLAGTPSGGLVTSLNGNHAEAVDVDADNRVWVALSAADGKPGGFTVYELNGSGALRNSDYNWLNAPIGSRQLVTGGPAPVWNSSLTSVAAVDEKVYASKLGGGIVTVAQRWQQLDETLSNQTVFGVWTERGRTFFDVGTGLYELKPDGLTYEFRATPGNQTHVMTSDGAGNLWMGTQSGPQLYLPAGFDDLSDRVGTRPTGDVYAIVEALDSDRNDGKAAPVWIGSSDGLTLFDRDRFVHTFTTANSGLPSNIVKSILVDNAGQIWVGTAAGLARLSPDLNTWTTFTTADGLPSSSIFDLAQMGDGTIAVSTYNGLSFYNGATFTTQTPPVPALSLPLSVDEVGRLWAGSALYTVTGWRGYWSTNSGIEYSTISDSATDGADRIWFSHAPNPGVSIRGTFLPPLKSITPVITSYLPVQGQVDTIMTINGFSLGSDASEITVTVGGSAVDIVSVTETQVQVKLRDATTSGAVSLTRGGKRTTATTPFCAVPQLRPGTTTSYPIGGNVGVEVSVFGSNFDPDAKIHVGDGTPRQVVYTSPTSLKHIVEADDTSGQFVITNHCATATVSGGSFRKIDLSIPSIALNQGMPGTLVQDKATLIQNFVAAAGAPGKDENVEIDEVRQFFTDRDGNVRRVDIPIKKTDIESLLLAGATPTDADRMTLAKGITIPNMTLTEPGATSVRTVLFRRGRPVTEATTTVDVAPNHILQVLLVPFMRPDATPQELNAMKADIEKDLTDLRQRVFPHGTVNVVWSSQVLHRSESFSLDNFLNLYRAAPDMDRVRRHHNNNPNRPAAQIAMGVVQPSLAAGSPGFAFGADVSQLLNTLILDDLDTLCDAVNGVVNTLSLGFLGSDDGCHLDIPLYMGWMKGDASSGSTLAHEIGHQLGLVKPWAPNGSLDDNLSHSVNDELPADMECTGFDGVSFDENKRFEVQAGVTRPIVNPILGTEFRVPDIDRNANNSGRAKAMMSYACGTTSTNTFFEPIDIAQFNGQVLPFAGDMLAVAKRLAMFGGSPSESPTGDDAGAVRPATAPVEVPARHAPIPASAPDTSGPRLHVFGVLDSQFDTGELIRVETYGEASPLTPSFATGYWLVQLDAAGNELARTGVAPLGASEPGEDAASGMPTQFMFSATVRRQANVARLELRHIDNVLDTFTAGGEAPLVTFVQPIGGELFDTTAVIEWTATDGDGDPLEVSIEYSADDGASWTSISSATGSGSVEIAVEQLAGSNGVGRFRVIASDGFLSGSAVSESFSVVDQAPAVSITAGLDGATLLEGQLVAIIGSAYDAEDGFVDAANVYWVSSRDGILGTGSSLLTGALSVGDHQIALYATDSAGLTSYTSTNLVVLGDYDFDGISDVDESASTLNALNSSDAAADIDGDGLSLLVERLIGADPINGDSDGDGRSDERELVDGTSSTIADAPLAPDQLSTSATSLSFVVDFAHETPLPQISLGVMSRLPADWELVSDVDWLEATSINGTTPSTTLLRLQAYKLAEGQYAGQIRFVGTTAENSAIVPITLTVINRNSYFDVDHDGAASAADCAAVQASVGLAFGESGYSLTLDVDRDGVIESTDVGTCNQAIGLSTLPGDFDSDNDVDADDIDLLFAAVRQGGNESLFDLSGDQTVNDDDVTALVEGILATRRGDANLDGHVDRRDAAIVARHFGGSGGWASGDFNGDLAANLTDLALVQSGFGVPVAPTAAAAVRAMRTPIAATARSRIPTASMDTEMLPLQLPDPDVLKAVRRRGRVAPGVSPIRLFVGNTGPVVRGVSEKPEG